MISKKYFRILILIPVLLSFGSLGCDALYRVLHKEGAEEKELFGEIIPFLYHPGVEEVQKLLKIYGYNIGEIDGKMGVNTRNAISAFQGDQHIKASRFIDQETWVRLNMFLEVELVVDAELNVRKVQAILKKEGFYPGSLDGRWGPRSQHALEEFQKTNGLRPDGTIGISTLSKLKECLTAQ